MIREAGLALAHGTRWTDAFAPETFLIWTFRGTQPRELSYRWPGWAGDFALEHGVVVELRFPLLTRIEALGHFHVGCRVLVFYYFYSRAEEPGIPLR